MKLSRFIVIEPVTEARLAREWDAINRRSRPMLSRGLAIRSFVLLPLAVTAALAVVALWRRPARSLLEGAVFGSDTGRVVVELVDGSRIEVEPKSRLSVAQGHP